MNSTMCTNISETCYSIDLAKDVLSFIAFLTTISGYLLAYSYLNSVSAAKECLLLYLYKDVGSAIVWIRSFWVIDVVLSKWNEIRKLQAIVISLGVWFGGLYLAIIINIISCLKFYMTKTGLVDPPIRWMGENEKSAIRRIRIICCLIVVGFLSTSFGVGLFPSNYYKFLGDPRVQPDLATSNLVYRGTLILLHLIFVISSLGMKLYKTINQPQVDKIVPRTINFIVAFLLFAMGFAFLFETLPFFAIDDGYSTYQMMMSIMHIVFPPIAILSSKQLKSHSLRILKNLFDEAFLLSIYFIPTFLFLLINGFVFIM